MNVALANPAIRNNASKINGRIRAICFIVAPEKKVVLEWKNHRERISTPAMCSVVLPASGMNPGKESEDEHKENGCRNQDGQERHKDTRHRIPASRVLERIRLLNHTRVCSRKDRQKHNRENDRGHPISDLHPFRHLSPPTRQSSYRGYGSVGIYGLPRIEVESDCWISACKSISRCGHSPSLRCADGKRSFGRKESHKGKRSSMSFPAHRKTICVLSDT